MDRSIIGRGACGRGAWGAIAAGLMPLAGCASFSGMPRPVLPLVDVVELARGDVAVASPASAGAVAGAPTGFGLRDALGHAIGGEDGAARQRYRDAFIGVQIAAIDAEYLDFRGRLSVQAKTANVGLDLGILALTGTGAVVGAKAANILSAGGSGLTGAKASLNREVYFDKTLPALIASMDARRLTMKATIVQKMRLPVASYSIAEAIADLSAYQMAASLDGAIDQITKDAVENRDDAQAHYDDVVRVCVVEDGVAPIWAKIAPPIRALTADERTRLDAVSDIVGSPRDGVFDVERKNILDRIATHYCSLSSATALLNRLTLDAGLELR